MAKTRRTSTGAELPPRARRIPPHAHIHATSGGTTSACAENTALFKASSFFFWNYLRVRGEYSWPFSTLTSKM